MAKTGKRYVGSWIFSHQNFTLWR